MMTVTFKMIKSDILIKNITDVQTEQRNNANHSDLH